VEDFARSASALKGEGDLQASLAATLCPSAASSTFSAAEGPSPLPVVRRPRLGECAAVARPCQFHACRFSLGEDAPANASCALDVADEGPRTLEEVADVLQVDREQVRQIEAKALRHVRIAADAAGLHVALEGGFTEDSEEPVP
jgi:hypothetical protein